jgi:hypothetical protein
VAWKRGAFFFAWALLLAPSARADSPFLCEEPEVLERGRWEVIGSAQVLESAGEVTGFLPQVEANYGATPDIELHLEAPIAFHRPEGGPFSLGPGDLELGVKHGFFPEGEVLPQAGTFVLFEAPTGSPSRGLGEDGFRFFFPLWLRKTFGPWETYGGAGYWVNASPGGKDWLFAGWVVERRILEGLTLGLELMHRAADDNGGEGGDGFNAGCRADLGGGFQLQLSAGRDWSGPNRCAAFLGLRWRP